MDFSFLGQPRPGAAPQGNGNDWRAGSAGAARPLIAVPSIEEVQQAEQQRAPGLNLFRPSGAGGPAGAAAPFSAPPPAQPQAQPQPEGQWQPPQRGSSGQAGSSYAAAAAAQVAGPGLAIPSFVQVGGQQQWQPPPASSSHWGTPGAGGSQPPSGGASGSGAPGGGQAAGGLGGAPVAAAQLAQHQAALAQNAILVSHRQRDNPLLRHIRNVRWQYADVVPDYLLGASTAALFLSLRYHLLHPDYLAHRLRTVQRAFRLLVLLLLVDVEDVGKPLADITKTAALQGATLVCAWSPEEAARYLETFKSYERKPLASIQERAEHDYVGRLGAALTCVRSVNRADAYTLGRTFGTLVDLLRATPEQLSACPGLGPTKVQRLTDAFHQPFKRELVSQPLPPGPGGAAGAASTSAAGALLAGAGPAIMGGSAAADAAARAAAHGHGQEGPAGHQDQGGNQQGRPLQHAAAGDIGLAPAALAAAPLWTVEAASPRPAGGAASSSRAPPAGAGGTVPPWQPIGAAGATAGAQAPPLVLPRDCDGDEDDASGRDEALLDAELYRL